MDSGRKLMSMLVTSPTRMSTSHVGVPQATGSRASEGELESSHYSYSRSITMLQCNKCGKAHSGACKLGQQGCYIYGQMDHRKIDYPRARSQGGAQSSRPATP